MAILGAYDPIFYAQETLKIIMQMYGLIGRVNRTFDIERRTFGRGQVANIRRPGTFVVTDGGTEPSQDIETETIPVTLDQFKQVRFGLDDQDQAYTGEQIIRDHIGPAAYQLGNYVNSQLATLAQDVPWFSPFSSTIVTGDITAGTKVLKDAAGNVAFDMSQIYLATDTEVDRQLQNLDTFHAANIAGNTNTSLVSGVNPGRFGIGEIFVDQTLGTHTSGTVVSAGTDLIGALTTNASKLDASIAIGSLSGVETLVAGDTFIIAGNDQRYAVTTDVTLAGGAATVAISPPLTQDYTSGAVVTFETAATAYADSYARNLLFHRDAFALVMAQLPETQIRGLGVDVFVAVDPVSGMSVRARRAYQDSGARVNLTLDILFGIKTINPNYAVVMRRDL